MKNIIPLFLLITLISGCKKKGCTDIYADNYNSSATKADYEQCIYSKTYIPDDNFENFLESQNLGDGIKNNDTVITNNLYTIENLDLMNLGINDITGIQDFINLKHLNIAENNITEIDVSNNTHLVEIFCPNTGISSIDLSNNPDLKYLIISNTNITSIDLSNNPNLENFACASNNINSLDLSNNSKLWFISCAWTPITELDLSNNNSLTQLFCKNSSLEKLDLRNGNNALIEIISAEDNPNLSCISVDDAPWSTSNWISINFEFDNQVSFSNNCQ
tara:strand:+ start:356 stop:1183 length:828 start_codon:yes stop_codon:yes gene_type:complete